MQNVIECMEGFLKKGTLEGTCWDCPVVWVTLQDCTREVGNSHMSYRRTSLLKGDYVGDYIGK